ncbi:MAG: TonB-dependent receptor [Gallionella sp.]
MRHLNFKFALTTSIAFTSAQLACAHENSGELSYFEEFPVVLSASRLSQPLSESPSAVTVIDHDMIVASGFRSIPDLFKLVPGMYVSYYSKGGQAIVSYHGTSDQFARRMQVLIDGRSVYLAPFSDVDWESLPIGIEDIERIEVVRGPSAAAYGANSLQGVISIYTHDASALSGASISATRGNTGISDASVRAGHRSDKVDYRFTAAYRTDNGYDSVPDEINLDSYITRLMNVRVNYRPNYLDNVDAQLGVSNGTRGVGFSNSVTDTPHDQFSRETFQQLTWQRALDNGDESKLRYYHILLNHDESTVTQPLDIFFGAQFSLSDAVVSDRNEIEWQFTHHLHDSHRIVWGAAYRSDFVESASFFMAPVRQRESRLFVHDEWHLEPSWIVNSGLMLENNGLGETDSSPQIALNYHVTPAQTVRASLSRAYRNPALFEDKGDRHYQFGPYPISFIKAVGGLKPEQVLSRELGYIGTINDLPLTVDVRLFHDQYTNLIVPDTNYTPISFTNSPSSMGQSGAETSIGYQPAANSKLIFNYSRNRISTTMTSFLHNMPEEQFSLFYTQKFAEFEVSLSYYNQSASLPADRPQNDWQAQHQRTDVRVARTFKCSDNISGDVSLTVQNLFDTDYTEYIHTNIFKRYAYVKASVNF